MRVYLTNREQTKEFSIYNIENVIIDFSKNFCILYFNTENNTILEREKKRCFLAIDQLRKEPVVVNIWFAPNQFSTFLIEIKNTGEAVGLATNSGIELEGKITRIIDGSVYLS